MGLAAEKHRYTIQEYLEIEETAEMRHEFDDGEILAMAGGTFEHSVLSINLTRLVATRLLGSSCQPLDSNLRIRIPRIPKYVYPDLSIVCGKPEFDPDDSKKKSILNPRVVFEILSETTALYDRGDKFSLYRRIDSFEEYVLISQDQPIVETYFRQPDGSWIFTPYHGTDGEVKLRSLPLAMPTGELYARIEFPAKS